MPDLIGYYLDPDDRDKVAKNADQQSKQPANTPKQGHQEFQQVAHGHYLVRVPCGEEIPPMEGAEPGKAECCIFQTQLKTDISAPNDYEIVPVLCNGEPVREIIYNRYDTAADDSRYWRADREKYGRLEVENPAGLTAAATTTTTTTTTTDAGTEQSTEADITLSNGTADAPQPTGCTNRCRWVWDDTTKEWTLDADNCTAPTTTSTTTSTTTTGGGTTTTTTTTSTTTTTTACLCPTTTTTSTTTTTGGPTTTTTAGPTTTTTTQAPQSCTCNYPTFCGTFDGECTYTDCSLLETSHPDCDQPATSTTTCDCNTSTTNTTTAPCSTGCTWSCSPNGWALVSGGCGPDCPCQPPPVECNDGARCDDYDTPCRVDVTTVPPSYCTGTCWWWWGANATAWALSRNDCRWQNWLGTCTCYPPVYTPASDCVSEVTPCGRPATTLPPGSTTTTTTAAPCRNCYDASTTTTSTTTAAPGTCDECKHQWNGTSWDVLINNCGDCDCGDPPYNGQETCETVWVPCGVETTTTADPSCCNITDEWVGEICMTCGGGGQACYDLPFVRNGTGQNRWTTALVLPCGDALTITLYCDPDYVPGSACGMWNYTASYPCATGVNITTNNDCDCNAAWDPDNPMGRLPTFSLTASDTSGCDCPDPADCTTTTTTTTTTTAAPTTTSTTTTTTAAPTTTTTTTTTAPTTTTTTPAPINDCGCSDFPDPVYIRDVGDGYSTLATLNYNSGTGRWEGSGGGCNWEFWCEYDEGLEMWTRKLSDGVTTGEDTATSSCSGTLTGQYGGMMCGVGDLEVRDSG